MISDPLPPHVRNFSVSGLKHGARYEVQVQALGDNVQWKDAEWSIAGSLVTPPAPVPDKLTDVAVTPGDGLLMVEWEEGDGNDVKVTGYKVQIKPDGKSWQSHYHEGTGTMTTVRGLTNGTKYHVRVKAINGSPTEADWSDVVSGTPMAGATPTPALPLFGVIGLGAGLLAAGGRRFHCRRA